MSIVTLLVFVAIAAAIMLHGPIIAYVSTINPTLALALNNFVTSMGTAGATLSAAAQNAWTEFVRLVRVAVGVYLRLGMLVIGITAFLAGWYLVHSDDAGKIWWVVLYALPAMVALFFLGRGVPTSVTIRGRTVTLQAVTFWRVFPGIAILIAFATVLWHLGITIHAGRYVNTTTPDGWLHNGRWMILPIAAIPAAYALAGLWSVLGLVALIAKKIVDASEGIVNGLIKVIGLLNASVNSAITAIQNVNLFDQEKFTTYADIAYMLIARGLMGVALATFIWPDNRVALAGAAVGFVTIIIQKLFGAVLDVATQQKWNKRLAIASYISIAFVVAFFLFPVTELWFDTVVAASLGLPGAAAPVLKTAATASYDRTHNEIYRAVNLTWWWIAAWFSIGAVIVTFLTVWFNKHGGTVGKKIAFFFPITLGLALALTIFVKVTRDAKGGGITIACNGSANCDGATVYVDGVDSGVIIAAGTAYIGDLTIRAPHHVELFRDRLWYADGQITVPDSGQFTWNTPVMQYRGPTCTDHSKNGAETDVDCGGGTCGSCAAGKDCAANTDCASGTCAAGKCQ